MKNLRDDHAIVLRFWEEHGGKFPYIFKVMLRVAAAQASNTSSERLFSRASWITTGRRNRKSGRNLERDVLLSFNSEV